MRLDAMSLCARTDAQLVVPCEASVAKTFKVIIVYYCYYYYLFFLLVRARVRTQSMTTSQCPPRSFSSSLKVSFACRVSLSF